MNALLGLVVSAATFLLTFDGGEKTRDIEQRINVDPSQRIEIQGFPGSKINFSSWDSNTIYVKLHLRIESSDRGYEERWIESVRISERRTSSGVVLTFEEPDRRGSSSGGFWSKLFGSNYVSREISGEIILPRSNPLKITMPYATVALDNMKGELEFKGESNTLTLFNCAALKDIDNNYGKTTIENSGGNLRLNSESGTLTVRDFKGTLYTDIKYSKGTYNQVSGAVVVNSESGTLKFDDIGDDLTVNANYSNIGVTNVNGFVDVRTESGTVRISKAKGVSADGKYSKMEIFDISGESKKDIVLKNESGNITLENAVGNVSILDPYATIKLKKIRGNLDVTTESGNVTAEDITGNWNSHAPYSNITLRSLSAQTVAMTNSGGSVDVELKTVPSSMKIKNDYAGVKVIMPKGFAGNVTLEATYASVESNLPIRVKSLGGGAYGAGTVGTGTGSIVIETESGNIRLFER